MERPQRLARKAEKETARRHGGRVTPMSGSGQAVKNDVRNGAWSFEVKGTTQKGYRLDRDVLATAEQNAMADGRKMALVLAFMPAMGKPWEDLRYVTTTEDDFLEREAYIAKLEAKIEADC